MNPIAIVTKATGSTPYRDGTISRFVVSEGGFRIVDRRRSSDPPLFVSVGRAEFAYAHWLPRGKGKAQREAPLDFPWDSWGVAVDLVMYNALERVERWAAENLGRPLDH